MPVARRRPAPAKAAPVAPPKQSLDDFAKTQRPGHTQVRMWLDSNPAIVQQVREGLAKGYSDHLIWKWLREQYAFPFSVQIVRGIQENRY